MEAILLFNLDYHPFIRSGGEYAQVAAFGLFIISKYRRWTQLRNVSKGFFLIGLICLLALIFGLLLMMFGPERVTLFRVIIYSALFLFEEYAYYYFERLQVPLVAIQNVKKPLTPKRRIFVPMTLMLKYLLREPDEHPFWVWRRVRDVSLWTGGILLLIFGFNQGIKMYTLGVAKGVQIASVEQKKTEVKTSQAVQQAVVTAVSSATIAIRKVADTLKQGQQHLDKKIDSSDLKAIRRAADVKRALTLSNKSTTSPIRLYIPAIPVLRQLPATLDHTDKVKTIRTDKKGRVKLSLVESDSAGAVVARKEQ